MLEQELLLLNLLSIELSCQNNYCRSVVMRVIPLPCLTSSLDVVRILLLALRLHESRAFQTSFRG